MRTHRRPQGFAIPAAPEFFGRVDVDSAIRRSAFGVRQTIQLDIMGLKTVWQTIKQTLADFSDDKVPRLAAALAYYTMFSLTPTLLIVIAVSGLIWGRDAVRGAITSQFSGLVGQEGGRQIETMIANASKPAAGTLALIVGIVTLIVGATGTFVQLKDALNTVWEVKLRTVPGWRGIWIMFRTYLLSFAMVLVIAFLLLATLVASAALAAIGKWLGDVLPIPLVVLQAMNLVVSFAIITLLFAAIYKVLPDVRLSWQDVWAGAAMTSLLFTLGKFALGMYLGRSAAASVYGMAGSVIVIMLWVYYASIIFLLGAEFTQVYARQWGTEIQPSALAEPASRATSARRRLRDKGSSRRGRDDVDDISREAIEARAADETWRTQNQAGRLHRSKTPNDLG